MSKIYSLFLMYESSLLHWPVSKSPRVLFCIHFGPCACIHTLSLTPSHPHTLTSSPSHPHTHTLTPSHPHPHTHTLTSTPSHTHTLTHTLIASPSDNSWWPPWCWWATEWAGGGWEGSHHPWTPACPCGQHCELYHLSSHAGRATDDERISTVC